MTSVCGVVEAARTRDSVGRYVPVLEIEDVAQRGGVGRSEVGEAEQGSDAASLVQHLLAVADRHLSVRELHEYTGRARTDTRRLPAVLDVRTGIHERSGRRRQFGWGQRSGQRGQLERSAIFRSGHGATQ